MCFVGATLVVARWGLGAGKMPALPEEGPFMNGPYGKVAVSTMTKPCVAADQRRRTSIASVC